MERRRYQMNIKGVELNEKALAALRLMQSSDSEVIALYLSAIDDCEDLLLTPEGIVPDITEKKRLATLRLLRYLKNDLTTLIHTAHE